MPDPIRCSADAAQPNTFSCEPVVIGAVPSAPSHAAQTPPQAAPPPPPSPAVTALVKRFQTSSHEVHADPVSTFTTNGVVQCLGQVNAVAVMMLGVKGPLLAAASAFKVGFDLGACVAKDENSRQSSADLHAAFQSCLDDGGMPIGLVGNQLMCDVAAVTP